jgi:multiple antibiotic resistance protein
MSPYLLSFISIFVAVDALGNVPIFISLTGRLKPDQRRRIGIKSVFIATIIIVLFVLGGKGVLFLMGITVADFKVAGGILLLVLSIFLLLRPEIMTKSMSVDVETFPLATPILAGPAVLTISIMSIDNYGMLPTFISVFLNMAITMVLFIQANGVVKLLGHSGTRAFSKVVDILLAAIAVMMIRKGIFDIVSSGV